ncbi:MAG: toll/interleukin-1 receptor domain-containing protein [Bifidobacteriaceae bacterium]|nr:toll/interleukin-1 receptor domain-containing protein [Bifidobacteriaceae bacterium]
MKPPPPFPAYKGTRPYAFVSYGHCDAYQVYDLIERLHRRGFLIWYDEGRGGVDASAEWLDYVAKRAKDCALFVVFMSPGALSRRGVRSEITHAYTSDRPILTVELEQTDVPDGVALATGNEQHTEVHTQGRDLGLADICQAFESHSVTRLEQKELEKTDNPPNGEAVAVAEAQDRGMPSRVRAPKPLSVSEEFADRVPESEALTASVERLQARLLGSDPLQDGVFPNVLVFHGGGGVGKTGLSEQLQRWVTGELAEDGDWSKWPHSNALAIRWDFHDCEGNLNLANLLTGLRQQLIPLKPRWLAFDLAVAAYLAAVRVDEEKQTGLVGKVASGVLKSLKEIAGALLIAIPTDLEAKTISWLSDAVLDAERTEVLTQRLGFSRGQLEHLRRVLDDCDGIPKGSQAPEVATDVLYCLTQAIHLMPAQGRPALVFFLDAFERLQRRGSSSPEATIAQFIANLPYCLFVVTGRDRLDWARPERTDLGLAGPHAWPGLRQGASEDPRQHVLGRLSDDDTRLIYRKARTAAGWNMSDQVIEGLVKRSEGLPLHIEAVRGLARNLDESDPGRPLSLADLDGELPVVVTRILDTLRPDEANAFRAACVLPFFDVALAQAVADVRHGDIERAIRYALVEHNPGSIYPWRVHDEIRRLVRIDRKSEGYWAAADWKAAAERAMAEAVRRIQEAHQSDSDAAELEAITLAVRIGYEWDTYYPGLAKMVTEAPTIDGLARFIPNVPDTAPNSEIAELIRWIRAMPLLREEPLEVFDRIRRGTTEAAAYAGRWHFYRLRGMGRHDEALAFLEDLLFDFPDHARLLQHQYAITLRLSRRFEDAIAHEAAHRPDQLPSFIQAVDRYHGILDGDPEIARQRRRDQVSKRFQFQLECTDLLAKARSVGVASEEVMKHLDRAVALRANVRERQCWIMLGYTNLANPPQLERVLVALRRTGRRHYALPHLLALRALLTGDKDDAKAAHDSVSPSGKRRVATWIANEVWLEELGYPLPPVETQWIIPYEQVRENWLRIAAGIIERAKAN